MKKMLLFIMAILCCNCVNSYSQTKGSFDTTITFNSESRAISLYVPSDYSPTTKMNLLIGLHGAGDNAKNFRNVVIKQATWNTIIPNTIMIFPDGGSDQNKDFYSPEGDQFIIDSVIAFAKANYNIDESKIILQGFSLGGRSALIYGLTYPNKIAGLLLHTPAVQSPDDVQYIDYTNASKVPMAISHGTADVGFQRTVKMLADSLTVHNAKMFYLNIPSLTHSITPNNITQVMLKYVSPSQISAMPFVQNIITPAYYCTSKVSPTCRVRNVGDSAITSMKIRLVYGDDSLETEWSGELLPHCFKDITLKEINLSDGYNYIYAFVSEYNNVKYEENQILNDMDREVNVYSGSIQTPFIDNMNNLDASANYWTVIPSGNYLTWTSDTDEIGTGDVKGGKFMVNTLLAYSNFGLTETLETAKFDLSNCETPSISFSVAYRYTIYTPPYFTAKTVLTDTLEVLVSNDCGESFSPLFKKWGDELATFETPLTNPTAIEKYLTMPKENEWKTVNIDIPKAMASANALFRFNYISGSGGVIFLDNFKAGEKSFTPIMEEKINTLAAYPNPARSGNDVRLELTNSGKVSIDLFDIKGEKVARLFDGEFIGTSLNITLPNLVSGTYMLRVNSANSQKVSKLVIE